MLFVDPSGQYFLVTKMALEELNKLTIQSPMTTSPIRTGAGNLLWPLKAIRVSRKVVLDMTQEEPYLENVAFLTDFNPPIWVADVPDIYELIYSPEAGQIFGIIYNLLHQGKAEILYKFYLNDSQKIEICGIWEPNPGEYECIPSGRIDELEKGEEGSFLEGTAVMEIRPKKEFIAPASPLVPYQTTWTS